MAHDTTPADRVRREERDDRTPPAIPFAVGPRGLQAKLLADERLQLLIDMRAYYAWLAAGRPEADPWDSGATANDAPRVKRHKPHTGYDAGRCTEPEARDLFHRIDDALASLQPFQRAMLHYRYGLNWTRETIARQLNLSDKQYSAAWQWVTRWLYWRLQGQ
jgi:DNA-directed RNA polymerase specialized sigma24 family protein